MTSNLSPANWSDFIDEYRWAETGEALLYRNPHNKTPDAGTIYIYSEEPGQDCIYDQVPIARGITAYIGHDNPGILGRDSIKVFIRLNSTFRTFNYFNAYQSNVNHHARRKNDSEPWPLAEEEFELRFFIDHLAEEKSKFEASGRFFDECKDEEDRLLKERLKTYVIAYLKWIDKKIKQIPSNLEVKSHPHAEKVIPAYFYAMLYIILVKEELRERIPERASKKYITEYGKQLGATGDGFYRFLIGYDYSRYDPITIVKSIKQKQYRDEYKQILIDLSGNKAEVVSCLRNWPK